MTSSAEYFDMSAAPMRIASVRLKVQDLDVVSEFYQSVLGLKPIKIEDRRVTLGTGSTVLVELVGDPTLSANDLRQAGLFHTAFLLPTRADLARWLAHVVAVGVPLQGASDHIVSEAIYLADPEGNGIEVYVDRPMSRWNDTNSQIQMATDPLDVQDLLNATGGTEWSGYPLDGVIGHVHLQVGDTADANGFYRDILGFEVAFSYPSASFYGSGGYHHQIAGNVWNSRRAGTRPEGMIGLDGVKIILRDAADLAKITARAQSAGIAIMKHTGTTTLHDPWGTTITLIV
ncbi:VOC family protein [Aliiroseovarius sp. S1339]|uniref:VOC family protein n=1 Tax=Aliiroseovarius sp. S1339 TaxID=2936990 RepID=UPI0020BDE896|nr:VOC family protein [Aliiroseovarius sp. S1339]MCK8465365.1 VOC family protein [Aliiroseovarius sp. S1339]